MRREGSNRTLFSFYSCFKIKFIWQFTALNLHIWLNLYWKTWKTVVQGCKLLKSLFKKPWGSSKWSFINLLFLFAWWARWKWDYCQFLGLSVYSWKFWLRQGGLSFYGFHKWNEGADTELMFQFCLPYIHFFRHSLLFFLFCFRAWMQDLYV